VHYLAFLEGEIKQGFDVGDRHLLEHVPKDEVKGEIIYHKTVHHPKRIAPAGLFDHKIGPKAQSQKDNDKIKGSEGHQNLEPDLGLKTCRAVKGFPLETQKVFEHGQSFF